MNLVIDSPLRHELPDIVVQFTIGDEAMSYATFAGYRYPVIMISRTVLDFNDIVAFRLDIGINSPIPTLSFAFKDTENRFKNSDYIDVDTEVVIWLGMPFAEPLPVKYLMKCTDVQVVNGTIYAEAVLKVSEEKLNFVHAPLQDMLEDFASQTKFGVKFRHDVYDDIDFRGNYTNVTALEFIEEFFNELHVPWYIDHEYKVVSQDIRLQILDDLPYYMLARVDKLLLPDEPLDEPQMIQYTNSTEPITQFKFWNWGYDYVKSDDPYVLPLRPMLFDKKALVEYEYLQRPEFHPLQHAPKYGVTNLSFYTNVNPYLRIGHTMPVVVFTEYNSMHRGTPPKVDDRTVDTDKSERIIEDFTGLYLIQSLTFEYMPFKNEIEVKAMLKFDEPRDIILDTANTSTKGSKEFYVAEDTSDGNITNDMIDDFEQTADTSDVPNDGKMISKHLSYATATHSATATKHKVSNDPTQAHLNNLKDLGYEIYDKVYEHFGGKVIASSVYRSRNVNSLINGGLGGSTTSQHMSGQAIDLSVLPPHTNRELYLFIRDNLPFDQMIWEFGDSQNPRWVHVSYKKSHQRKQQLHKTNSSGSTKYLSEATSPVLKNLA